MLKFAIYCKGVLSNITCLSRKRFYSFIVLFNLQGQHQKKMALQGKMLHLRQKIRKESFLQPGGMKKLMSAPGVLQAFKSEVSVSCMVDVNSQISLSRTLIYQNIFFSCIPDKDICVFYLDPQFFSFTPDKDIRVFYLDLQLLSHPCHLTQDRIKITCI